MNDLLTKPAEEMNQEYRTVIIGSGHGGAIVAARLAEAGHQDICLLERGKEWVPGDFPDQFGGLLKNLRRPGNPLGLFDYQLNKEIDVLRGCGLGGTSLINANVAIRPDKELFDNPRWPQAIQDLADSGQIWPFYREAETMLGVGPHPRAAVKLKVQAMKERADQLADADFSPSLPLDVHFGDRGANHVGVHQNPCIDCGDCFTGCNVRAKNTLYMNYLPFAESQGVDMFAQVEISHLTKTADGKYSLHYRVNKQDGQGELQQVQARHIVLAAGSLGSTELLLRSRKHGLPVSDILGKRFSGKGDFVGISYTTDQVIEITGYGNHPDSRRAAVQPGPSIISGIQYNRSRPFADRFIFEDTSIPLAAVDISRRVLPFVIGRDMQDVTSAIC